MVCLFSLSCRCSWARYLRRAGRQSCRLRAQTALAQAHALIVPVQGVAHLLYGEVALGTHEHGDVVGGACGVALLRGDGVEEVLARYLGVAMADEAPALLMGIDKRTEGGHLVDHGLPRLAALLHGRHDDLVDAVGTERPALRKLRVEEAHLVPSHLGGLLRHPLHAPHVLGRGNGQMDVAAPRGLLGLRLLHAVGAVVGCRQRDGAAQKTACAVDEEDLVSLHQPQHAHGVACLLAGQLVALSRLGHIEVSGFFHCGSSLEPCSLLRFSSSFLMLAASS